MDAELKQDMPPRGGYARILYQRTFPKTWVNWKRLLGMTVALQVYMCFRFKANLKRKTYKIIEENDVHCAIEPFLMAERDRQWLHTLHRLREEEREAMKNVPGWKVGTWYGEPLYFTLPPEKWWDPQHHEIYQQSREIDQFMYEHMKWQEWEVAPKWYHKYFPAWLMDISKMY